MSFTLCLALQDQCCQSLVPWQFYCQSNFFVLHIANIIGDVGYVNNANSPTFTNEQYRYGAYYWWPLCNLVVVNNANSPTFTNEQYRYGAYYWWPLWPLCHLVVVNNDTLCTIVGHSYWIDYWLYTNSEQWLTIC